MGPRNTQKSPFGTPLILMLTLLYVKDFALVEEAELQLGPRLCLLTGETGAGKSILVQALGLLTGERADTEMVRTGREESVLESHFQPQRFREEVEALLAKWQIPFDGEIVIRRRVLRAGRSPITVNGAGVSLGQLRELGRLLVHIHGQSEGQTLLDEETHRQMLDDAPDVRGHATLVAERHAALAEAVSTLRALRRSEGDRAQRLESIRLQLQEIERVDPREGEEEDLLSARARLQNAERIVSWASRLHDLLGGGDASAARQLAEASRIVRELAAVDPAWAPLLPELEQAAGVVAGTSSEAERTAATVAFDPQALENTLQRLADLDRLKRRFGPELEDVIGRREALERELELLLHGPMDPKEAAAQVEERFKAYLEAAERLSGARARASAALAKSVESELRPLAMEKAVFKVELLPRPPLAPEEAAPEGLEEVRFLFSANPGEPPKPLSRIASGGELSRTLLAILTAAATDRGPDTLVFDEVDAGIGGRPAERVGRRLKDLAGRHQVLCVTHLPQIAAFAHQHTRIRKIARTGRTVVAAQVLSDEERAQEIARMLAGEKISETAVEHARTLLSAAAKTSS